LNNSIVIVDYNMGNLRSVKKSFLVNNCNVLITNDHEKIINAEKIVLPGVGAFPDAMRQLKELDLIDLLNEEVLINKKPFLGICLGMQLMATLSYENKKTNGLGWIDAEIVQFNFDNDSLKIPHVGWNTVTQYRKCELYKGVPNYSDFYHVHSFHYSLNEDIATGTTDYGYQFVSSIAKDNLFGFQFHPEKSQNTGLRIIKNFIDL
jgi:glutamine amidotransferase